MMFKETKKELVLKIAFVMNSGKSQEDLAMATCTYCRLRMAARMFTQLQVSYHSRFKAMTDSTVTVPHGTLDLKREL